MTTTKTCTLIGCNEPRYKTYHGCHAHMQEEWRERENRSRKRPPDTPKKTSNIHPPMAFQAGQTVRFQMIEWVSGKVYEFEATATGSVTVIDEREDGQASRIRDAWIDDGSLMVLALRRDA